MVALRVDEKDIASVETSAVKVVWLVARRDDVYVQESKKGHMLVDHLVAVSVVSSVVLKAAL